jgi:hypothetical protein
MRDSCDYENEMRQRDDAFEAALRGGESTTDIAAVVAAVRHAAVAVEPDDELVRLFAEGLEPVAPAGAAPADASVGRVRRMWQPLVARFAGVSLAVKLLMGSTVAVAGVTAGAAGGNLPDPAQDAVAGVVNSATIFEFPTSASERAEFGRETAETAHERGVDGATVSQRATLRERYEPVVPTRRGLERAAERTERAPTDVPGPPTQPRGQGSGPAGDDDSSWPPGRENGQGRSGEVRQDGDRRP